MDKLEAYIREKQMSYMEAEFARAFHHILNGAVTATERHQRLERLCGRLTYTEDRNTARDVAALFD